MKQEVCKMRKLIKLSLLTVILPIFASIAFASQTVTAIFNNNTNVPFKIFNYQTNGGGAFQN